MKNIWINRFKKIKVLTIIVLFLGASSQLKSGEWTEPTATRARARAGAVSLSEEEKQKQMTVAKINDAYNATFGEFDNYFDYHVLILWNLASFQNLWIKADDSLKDYAKKYGAAELMNLADQVIEQKQRIINVLTELQKYAKKKGKYEVLDKNIIDPVVRKLNQIKTVLDTLLEKKELQSNKYGKKAKTVPQQYAADLVAYYAQKIIEAINKIVKSAPAS